MNRLFSPSVLNVLDEILQNCERKIIVTLDKFDEGYEAFRVDAKGTPNEGDVIDFEAIWCRSLVNTVYNIKHQQTDQIENIFVPLSKLITFCICLPYDRYLGFIQDSRDAYRFNNDTIPLTWTGVELSILLRKRIENIFMLEEDINASWKSIDPKMSPEDVLKYCIDLKYPKLPSHITLSIKSGTAEMPLFQYMLSRSFWRPRDIMEQFASIITSVSLVKKADSIQSLIKRNCAAISEKIIRNEFWGEFGKIYTNLEAITYSFFGANQLMSYNELFEILSSDSIKLTRYDGALIDNADKIFEILYELGFLGIRATENFQDACHAGHKDIICFCEGFQPLNGIKTDEFKECNFFINPIFTEVLQFKINCPDLICNYPWDYLYHGEGIFD